MGMEESMSTKKSMFIGGFVSLAVVLAASLAFVLWPRTPEENEADNTRIPTPNMEHELATTAPSSRPQPARVAEAEVPAEPEVLAEPAPDPYEPSLDSDSPLHVRRLIISTGVRAYEPTGAANHFERGEFRRLYAFVDAANRGGEEGELIVTFEPPEGEVAGHVSLEVPAGAPRYRTWAYTRHVYTPGRWHAVIRCADGREVARRAFDVD